MTQLDEINRLLGTLQGGQHALSDRLDRIEQLAAEDRATAATKLDAIHRQLSQAAGGIAVGRALLGAWGWIAATSVAGAWAAFTYIWPPKGH